MEDLNKVLNEHNMYNARHASCFNPNKGTVPIWSDKMLKVPRKVRHSGFENFFLKLPDFPERSLLVDCVRELFNAQQLPSTRGIPSLQDALTLLQALLYNPASDFANDVLQRAAITQCNALSELQSHQESLAKLLAAKEEMLRLQTAAASVPPNNSQSSSRSGSSRSSSQASQALQQHSPNKQASTESSAGKSHENQKLTALRKEVEDMKQEIGALRGHRETLNALLKRLDLLAESRSPGFVERHMERILRDGSFGTVFISTHGTLIGRTSDDRMLLTGGLTVVPRSTEELRKALETHVRGELKQMALEKRQRYLREKLSKMKASEHLITDLPKVFKIFNRISN